ncbi:MAG: metallophosphoesterase [Oscillospiraceae bacterium]|nr:metallophosphoesterase [Oscillospiraceae bacterium]
MALYVIGDLHLSLGSNKPMEIFGEKWANHVARLREAFSSLTEEDVTVLVGDTSWGISLEEALPDFRFIDALPGKKIILKGNHDYWWGTAKKMKEFFAANDITSIDILHNNCFFYGDYAICGSRGWFYEEEGLHEHTDKMIAREVLRLETSFAAAQGKDILCFLHYPPIYHGYQCPELLAAIDRAGAKMCFYGHLHGVTHKRAFEGKRQMTEYALISADYLAFQPKKICE